MSTQRLTIFLLQDVSCFEEALNDGRALESRELAGESGLDGCFYWAERYPATPSWAKYLGPVVEGGVPDLKSASASGLLLLRVDGRTFALTFGYARSFLDQSRIERRFGLKVALSLIDEDRIRSLDTKMYDEMVVAKNTQTSRTTDLPSFGVDVMRDILRAVSGVAPPDSGYRTITGADAVVLGIDKDVTQLPTLLRDLYRRYTSGTYQQSFGWVDQLSEVRDPTVRDALDSQLVAQLRSKDTSFTHMAMPENLDWEDVEHFLITPTTRDCKFEELDLDTYLAQPSTRAAELTLKLLKSRKVSVKFLRGSEPDTRWSVYLCLVSEQRLGGRLHALIEGRWFEIADSLVSAVDAVIDSLPVSSVSLPPALAGEHEGDYNERAVRADAALALLDKRLVKPDGATSPIEFCDLMSSDGSIIHVKRKSRSSTLSHLFAQGQVSAEALVDGVMREQVRSAIAAAASGRDPQAWLDLIPPAAEGLERDRYTITYAVITDSKATGAHWLPFFSRLSLMQTVRDLARLGFSRVALTRVPLQR